MIQEHSDVKYMWLCPRGILLLRGYRVLWAETGSLMLSQVSERCIPVWWCTGSEFGKRHRVTNYPQDTITVFSPVLQGVDESSRLQQSGRGKLIHPSRVSLWVCDAWLSEWKKAKYFLCVFLFVVSFVMNTPGPSHHGSWLTWIYSCGCMVWLA